MAEHTPHKINLNAMDFANDDASEEGTRAIRYLASRLQEAQSNPKLRAIVYEQMQARALFLDVPQERVSLFGTTGIAKKRRFQRGSKVFP